VTNADAPWIPTLDRRKVRRLSVVEEIEDIQEKILLLRETLRSVNPSRRHGRHSGNAGTTERPPAIAVSGSRPHRRTAGRNALPTPSG
jgi:hypothetical protein